MLYLSYLSLQKPEYRNVLERYNKMFGIVKYTEMACGDLDKYHKVRPIRRCAYM